MDRGICKCEEMAGGERIRLVGREWGEETGEWRVESGKFIETRVKNQDKRKENRETISNLISHI